MTMSTKWLPSANPQTRQTTWTASPVIGCNHPHSPSPFHITQPNRWYSSYHPTKGRRLRWSSKGKQPMVQAIIYHNGIPRWDLVGVRHVTALNHCDLQMLMTTNQLTTNTVTNCCYAFQICNQFKLSLNFFRQQHECVPVRSSRKPWAVVALVFPEMPRIWSHSRH